MNPSGIRPAFFCEVGTEGVISFSYNSCFKRVNSLKMHFMQLVVTVRHWHYLSHQSVSKHITFRQALTLSLLMSYICGAPCKARNFNVVYIMDLRLPTLKAVSFYLLHNVSTSNQYRKLFCVTAVCKHFASYQGYPNYT
jgi:hypothetical protein